MSTAEKPQHDHDHGAGTRHYGVPEPRPGSHDDAIPMTPEEIQEMLNPSPRQRKRVLGLVAAGMALATTAALTLTGVMDTSPDKIIGKPVAASANDSADAGRQPQDNPSIEATSKPEHKPLRGSLCGQIELTELLEWTGEKSPEAYTPDKAKCTAKISAEDGTPYRAHGNWSWANLRGTRNSTIYDQIDVAVYDEVTYPDGSSTFFRLLATYAPARSEPIKVGDHDVTIASANGSTLVNLPESGIDITITTRLNPDLVRSPGSSYPGLQKGQVQALPKLVTAIVQG